MEEVKRYLRWWVPNNKWSNFILLVPFLLLLSPVAVVNNLVHGRLLAALASLLPLVLGLLFLFADFLNLRRSRPWNKPPWHDPEYTGAPWNRP